MLIDVIDRYGYTMREWGTWAESARSATNDAQYDTYYARAERYREAAKGVRDEVKAKLDELHKANERNLDLVDDNWRQQLNEDKNDRSNKAFKVYEQYEKGLMTPDEAVVQILAIVTNS